LDGPFWEDPVISHPTVLVVEDEQSLLAMLGVALRKSGIPVFLAGNGEEALTLYRKHQTDIAVVLIDVQMPGMDGFQVLAALRELNPQIRAVFMSGNTVRYSTEELLGLGATFVLSKPFAHLTDVVRVLRAVADKELPGSVGGQPTPSHGLLPNTWERRGEPRLEGNSLRVQLITPKTAEPSNGIVLNRSLQGMCVRTEQATPTGAVLNVRSEMMPIALWMAVEVKYCRQQNHHWVLGCRFLNAPSMDDLLQFGYGSHEG
jgi:two-component system, OmpR family, response regulator